MLIGCPPSPPTLTQVLDGRVTLVELTPAGAVTAERLHSISVQHLQDALGSWSERERRDLAGALERLVDDLRATPLVAEPRR